MTRLRLIIVRTCAHSDELQSKLSSLQTKEGSAQDELIIEPVTELASKRLREERDKANVELEELFPKRKAPSTFHRGREACPSRVVTE